ncbi:MAG: DUF6817 domain-containing protein [Gemmataceae bacterium]
MASTNFKHLTDFLIAQGIDKIGHTQKTYLAHLIGVYRDLESWGCAAELCQAGMFHSIYGTERFQGFKLPLTQRDEVRQLIGDRAEWLAYLNCAIDRTIFDHTVPQQQEPYVIRDRITGADVTLSENDFNDLCRIHLCDWLEQVPRSREWDYRRAAYRHMAARLGGAALEAYERVFAAALS